MVKGRNSFYMQYFYGELVLALRRSGSPYSEITILASQVSMVNGDQVHSNRQWQPYSKHVIDVQQCTNYNGYDGNYG